MRPAKQAWIHMIPNKHASTGIQSNHANRTDFIRTVAKMKNACPCMTKAALLCSIRNSVKFSRCRVFRPPRYRFQFYLRAETFATSTPFADQLRIPLIRHSDSSHYVDVTYMSFNLLCGPGRKLRFGRLIVRSVGGSGSDRTGVSREGKDASLAVSRKCKASANILLGDLWKAFNYLFMCHAGSQPSQHIRDGDPHAADARSATPLP